METSIVERAFQLARSGKYSKFGDIRRALKAEGYLAVEQHLSGVTIRAEIRKCLRNAGDAHIEGNSARASS
jgi:hypothetical protein